MNKSKKVVQIMHSGIGGVILPSTQSFELPSNRTPKRNQKKSPEFRFSTFSSALKRIDPAKVFTPEQLGWNAAVERKKQDKIDRQLNFLRDIWDEKSREMNALTE